MMAPKVPVSRRPLGWLPVPGRGHAPQEGEALLCLPPSPLPGLHR